MQDYQTLATLLSQVFGGEKKSTAPAKAYDSADQMQSALSSLLGRT